MMNDDNPFYRSFMALDSWLSTAGFETVDFIQRSGRLIPHGSSGSASAV